MGASEGSPILSLLVCTLWRVPLALIRTLVCASPLVGLAPRASTKESEKKRSYPFKSSLSLYCAPSHRSATFCQSLGLPSQWSHQRATYRAGKCEAGGKTSHVPRLRPRRNARGVVDRHITEWERRARVAPAKPPPANCMPGGVRPLRGTAHDAVLFCVSECTEGGLD